MSKGRTDFRWLQAKREAALARPELRRDAKPTPLTDSALAAAVASGRFQKLPSKRRRL
jgi:hypothetical protein